MSPKLKKALLIGGVALVAGCVLLEGLVHDAHHDDPTWTLHWYHQVPGWNALLGFAGCVVIIVFSKLLGKLWLQKPEGYYDE